MYLIAGLGNPGREYDGTRHNAGFEAIDLLAEKLGISISEKKHKGLIGRGSYNGTRLVLVKPQTYMNLSGECIGAAAHFYDLEPQQVIILHDDISLQPGRLRIRMKGSAGGHNGLKSIISCLGSQDFARVKIGVGEKPEGWDLADWVLGRFKKEDLDDMKNSFRDAADAALLLATGESAQAMNIYNKR